jgi:NitT/TauT family transport system substrate-binding protein
MLKRSSPLGSLLALLLLVSACGGGASTSPSASQAASQSAPGSTSAAPSASQAATLPEPETKKFTVAFTSPGVSSVPLLQAIEDLNSQGFEIDHPVIGESELAVQGVFQGKFAYSSGTTNGVMLANQQGGDIKIISSRVANEWTVYGTKEIADCMALDGKKLAIHSEGAVSTAMVKNWVDTECPGTKPNYLIVEGSQNRLAALLAGQIDASPLELADAIVLEQKGGDKFHLLTSLAETLPKLKPTTVYGNNDFMKKNPGTTEALIKAQLDVHRKIANDPAYFKQIILKFLPDTDQSTLDTVVQRYLDLKLFDPNGGISEDDITYTIDFFTKASGGNIKPGLTAKDVADLSYLNAVLVVMGRK